MNLSDASKTPSLIILEKSINLCAEDMLLPSSVIFLDQIVINPDTAAEQDKLYAERVMSISPLDATIIITFRIISIAVP